VGMILKKGIIGPNTFTSHHHHIVQVQEKFTCNFRVRGREPFQSRRMVISYLFLFLAFTIDLGECQNNGCPELRCGGHGPAIRFPFRVNSQPEHCGYPGFSLSCTDTNDTVVELPISVKLFVKQIDYKSQVIQLYDPDRCISRKIRRLNLSSSPFQFEVDYPHHRVTDFALFNCSSREVKKLELIPCLSSPNHQVYAFDTDDDLMEYPLSSCTKIYTLRSIPNTTMLGDDEKKNLELKWSRPVCGRCEAKGKKCRLKSNSTELETECFLKGIVFGPISTLCTQFLHSFQAKMH
jgi:hypothetical protein